MYIEAPLCMSFMNCSMFARCCKFSTAALQHSHKRHTMWSFYISHVYRGSTLCVVYELQHVSKVLQVQHCSTFQTNPQSESSILSHIYRGFTLWVGLELQHVCQVLQVKYCSTLHSKPTNKVKAGIYTCNSIEASLCWLVKLSRKVQSVH